MKFHEYLDQERKKLEREEETKEKVKHVPIYLNGNIMGYTPTIEHTDCLTDSLKMRKTGILANKYFNMYKGEIECPESDWTLEGSILRERIKAMTINGQLNIPAKDKLLGGCGILYRNNPQVFRTVTGEKGISWIGDIEDVIHPDLNVKDLYQDRDIGIPGEFDGDILDVESLYPNTVMKTNIIPNHSMILNRIHSLGADFDGNDYPPGYINKILFNKGEEKMYNISDDMLKQVKIAKAHGIDISDINVSYISEESMAFFIQAYREGIDLKDIININSQSVCYNREALMRMMYRARKLKLDVEEYVTSNHLKEALYLTERDFFTKEEIKKIINRLDECDGNLISTSIWNLIEDKIIDIEDLIIKGEKDRIVEPVVTSIYLEHAEDKEAIELIRAFKSCRYVIDKIIKIAKTPFNSHHIKVIRGMNNMDEIDNYINLLLYHEGEKTYKELLDKNYPSSIAFTFTKNKIGDKLFTIGQDELSLSKVKMFAYYLNCNNIDKRHYNKLIDLIKDPSISNDLFIDVAIVSEKFKEVDIDIYAKHNYSLYLMMEIARCTSEGFDYDLLLNTTYTSSKVQGISLLIRKGIDKNIISKFTYFENYNSYVKLSIAIEKGMDLMYFINMPKEDPNIMDFINRMYEDHKMLLDYMYINDILYKYNTKQLEEIIEYNIIKKPIDFIVLSHKFNAKQMDILYRYTDTPEYQDMAEYYEEQELISVDYRLIDLYFTHINLHGVEGFNLSDLLIENTRDCIYNTVTDTFKILLERGRVEDVMELIDIVKDFEYDKDQLYYICNALVDGYDIEKYFLNYNPDQMKQLYKAQQMNIDISKFSPDMNVETMKKLRKSLTPAIDISDYI